MTRRPVSARAMVTEAVVASVPFFANIAQSAWAMRSTSRSASSTMTGAGPFMLSPSAPWRAAANSTAGSRWPRITGPQAHIRSTKRRPSASQTWPPSAREKNCG
jgi:hypothetical protein